MTSQPQPAPGEGRTPGQYLRPLRDLAAWALVGAPAVLLFVAIIRLIPAGDGEQFASRTQDSFYCLRQPADDLLPARRRAARPAGAAAAPEGQADHGAGRGGVRGGRLLRRGLRHPGRLIQIGGFSVRTAFEELLVRAAWLAVFGLAAVRGVPDLARAFLRAQAAAAARRLRPAAVRRAGHLPGSAGVRNAAARVSSAGPARSAGLEPAGLRSARLPQPPSARSPGCARSRPVSAVPHRLQPRPVTQPVAAQPISRAAGPAQPSPASRSRPVSPASPAASRSPAVSAAPVSAQPASMQPATPPPGPCAPARAAARAAGLRPGAGSAARPGTGFPPGRAPADPPGQAPAYPPGQAPAYRRLLRHAAQGSRPTRSPSRPRSCRSTSRRPPTGRTTAPRWSATSGPASARPTRTRPAADASGPRGPAGPTGRPSEAGIAGCCSPRGSASLPARRSWSCGGLYECDVALIPHHNSKIAGRGRRGTRGRARGGGQGARRRAGRAAAAGRTAAGRRTTAGTERTATQDATRGQTRGAGHAAAGNEARGGAQAGAASRVHAGSGAGWRAARAEVGESATRAPSVAEATPDQGSGCGSRHDLGLGCYAWLT